MRKLVLLATYNGAAFLPEQLESILSQAEGWKLLVRDDGSHDGTRKLLRHIVDKSSAVIVIDDGLERLGAPGNFARLLENAKEQGVDYCALADQDDLWLPAKLAEQLTQIKMLEQKFPHCPILIHSDLEVVNRNLETIHPSFMQYQGIQHEDFNQLKVLLCQNFVTGSTVMVNRSLLELALPVPKEALMHDWWLALCAAAFGRLEYVSAPLVKYRQHGNNEVGAINMRHAINPLKNNWKAHWCNGCDNLGRSILQAQTLAERIRKHDPKNIYLPLVEDYASLLELAPLNRIKKLKSSGIHMQSLLRHLLMISRLPFS